MTHRYPPKFIINLKFTIFVCHIVAHVMNIILPVTCSYMLKILKLFFCDPSHKVIMGLNSVSYAIGV